MADSVCEVRKDQERRHKSARPESHRADVQTCRGREVRGCNRSPIGQAPLQESNLESVCSTTGNFYLCKG